MRYIHYQELQQFMKEYYEHTGKTLSFAKALERTLEKGIIHDGVIHPVDFSSCNILDAKDINHYVDQIAIPYEEGTIELESGRSLHDDLIVFKYPSYSRAGIHIQDGLELNYVYRGSCTMFFDGNEYAIHENEVVIIPPNTAHDVYDTEDAIVFSFLIHQDLFNETFFQVIQTDTALATFYNLCLYQFAKMFLRFQIKEPTRFVSIFLAMYSEFASDKQYRYDICVNYIRILFAFLLRQPKPSFEHESLDASQHLLNDMPVILRYIKSNFMTVSLNFLADFFHYDRSYLGKQIKKYTNMSFSDLLTGYRMEYAVNLLLHSKQSIEEIAEKSGYQSADHFSRMFKKQYCIAPSKYRNATVE